MEAARLTGCKNYSSIKKLGEYEFLQWTGETGSHTAAEGGSGHDPYRNPWSLDPSGIEKAGEELHAGIEASGVRGDNL